MGVTQHDAAVELIRMEYAEFPELKLPFWQAQRLWNLQGDICARALQALVDGRVLARTEDGAYVRSAWAGASPLPSTRWRGHTPNQHPAMRGSHDAAAPPSLIGAARSRGIGEPPSL